MVANKCFFPPTRTLFFTEEKKKSNIIVETILLIKIGFSSGTPDSLMKIIFCMRLWSALVVEYCNHPHYLTIHWVLRIKQRLFLVITFLQEQVIQLKAKSSWKLRLIGAKRNFILSREQIADENYLIQVLSFEFLIFLYLRISFEGCSKSCLLRLKQIDWFFGFL